MFILVGVYPYCFLKLRHEASRSNTDVLMEPLPYHCLSHSLTIFLSMPRLFSPSHPPVQNKVDPACLQGEPSINYTQYYQQPLHSRIKSLTEPPKRRCPIFLLRCHGDPACSATPRHQKTTRGSIERDTPLVKLRRQSIWGGGGTSSPQYWYTPEKDTSWLFSMLACN